MEQNQPTVSLYKGHYILTLNPEEKYPFSFGLAKAQMILKNYEEIKKFVDHIRGGGQD